MSESIDKLGTVLAVQNEINKNMIELLQEQQRRQVRMIWASLAIVLVAFIIVGVSMFCAFQSFDRMNQQIERYYGGSYETNTETGERLPQ